MAVSMVMVVDCGRVRVHVRNCSVAHTVVVPLMFTTATIAYFFESGVLATSSLRPYVVRRLPWGVVLVGVMFDLPAVR